MFLVHIKDLSTKLLITTRALISIDKRDGNKTWLSLMNMHTCRVRSLRINNNQSRNNVKDLYSLILVSKRRDFMQFTYS